MFRQKCTAALAALVALGSFTFAMAQQPKAVSGEKQITNSIGMKLTLVPSGEFMMGSGESAEATAAFFNKTFYGSEVRKTKAGMWEVKADWFKDETPQHRVRITKPFCLGTYHVTRGQFRQFVADTKYKTDAEDIERIIQRGMGDKPGADGWCLDEERWRYLNRGYSWRLNHEYSWRSTGFEQTDEHPVVCVSWNDAVAFCEWLSRKEGKTYRLPTEAEWEYACRGGTTTRFSSGDDPETLAKIGNIADATLKAKFPGQKYTIKSSDGWLFTSPVGSFQPNAFALCDMHGNALQWCSDWYSEKYYATSPAEDPRGPDIGSNYRVIRGSSWFGWPFYSGSAFRGKSEPYYRSTQLGFRVARAQ